jgi:DNA-binding transcriptional ArsR family regulator
MKPLRDVTDPRFVKALAHPLRVRIMSVLQERTASPSEIAAELGEPIGNVAYHVRQLADLGVVKLTRETQVRGAIEHHYEMDAHPSITDEAWRGAPEVAKRSLATAVLGQVSDQVNAAVEAGRFSTDGTHVSRLPLELDERGWDEVGKELKTLSARLERIEAASKKRRRGARADARTATVVLMLFERAKAPRRSATG